MTGPSESRLLQLACILAVLGISCPASASPVLRDSRLSTGATIGEQPQEEIASTTVKQPQEEIESTTVEQPQQKIESTTRSSSVQQRPLPTGYVAYPDVGFAYKFHEEYTNLLEAEERCRAEGGHLATIDSEEKLRHALALKTTPTTIFVGIQLFDGAWRSIGSGLPLANLPWGDGEPMGDGDCVVIDSNGLADYWCRVPRKFMCELPIPEQNLAR